jgi:uncharacterized protein YndB with AHSA1/START domain
MSDSLAADRIELTLTRRFAASPESVFRAWIDPTQLARWMGPPEVQAKVVTLEPRLGGAYRLDFDGGTCGTNIVGGTYREIVPHSRLVFTWAWQEGTGLPTQETLVTVTFRAIGAETEMTLKHERFDSADGRDRHGQGWNGSFDKLAALLAGESAAA